MSSKGSANPDVALLIHELRRPIGLALGFDEMGIRSQEVESNLRYTLQVCEAAESLAGLRAPRYEYFNLIPIVDEIGKRYFPILKEPEPYEEFLVYADATHVKVALAMLIENAFQHADTGLVDIYHMQWMGRHVTTISNPGYISGDPFEWGLSHNGSTGRGLWISRKILRDIGGDLRWHQDDGIVSFHAHLMTKRPSFLGRAYRKARYGL